MQRVEDTEPLEGTNPDMLSEPSSQNVPAVEPNASIAAPSALPSISIVTPSYNQGQYLEETMCSVLDQKYPNLQYIVVDGGSTDNSVEIIKKYEKHLSFWVSEKDRGQTDAINKGIRRCTGDIFGYINSDDLLLPRSLHAVAESWNRGYRWIVGWCKYMELGGGDWPYMVRTIQRKADWFIDNPIPQQSSFFDRKYFDQLGLFREDLHYCFDYEYWMRMHFKGQLRPEIIRQCLSAFRLHDASKTVSVWDKFEKEFDIIHAEYRPYLSAKDRLQWWSGVRAKQAEFARERMWKALKVKDVTSARKEARAAFAGQPLSVNSWKSLFFAFRGH
jgi:glycosyltransferase involved in cell wall biosynthesis